MYYSCKDKSLSETSGFQEKITADGMNNLVLKQEALQIYYEHNYYIYNNVIVGTTINIKYVFTANSNCSINIFLNGYILFCS